jgi:TPR repeat protein
MKTNLLVLLLLFLILGVAAAQQTNSTSIITNSGAIAELKAKAEKGNANAQFSLGDCYRTGQGVPQDFVEAAKWYQKAAEQGNAICQYDLGLCFEKGNGVSQDYKEAIKWFRKAAEQDFEAAQLELYQIYFVGKGVETNHTEAVKWLRKAVEHGNMLAQFDLGQHYLQGDGVPEDYAEAAKWYRKAADQGEVNSQYNLGGLFDKGKGMPQNDVEAYFWYSLAAAQGATDAAHNRDGIAYRMSREEIIEGQRRAAAFIPHKNTANSSPDNFISPENPTASGTGFFITDDGYLISNYHVVKGAAKVRLLTGAGLIDATVVKVDAANDLALLKAAGKFAPLPIAASRAVKLGGTVATVGFPDIGLQGFAPKLAKGEIASLAGAADDPRYFQISVPVQPGNSGGALVDARGNVVGIVAAKLNARAALDATGSLPENVNYAVKSSLLLSFLESVPEVAAKLKEPNAKDEAFEDVVKAAQDAAVLVLVY